MGKVTILGCGASGGVPLATGFWGACNPDNPKNRRMRASIAVQDKGKTLVIDTGPDFHQQTLKYGITQVDGILYTHAHSDHVNGIDELRYISFVKKERVPIWADANTMNELQSRFAHMFLESPDGLYKPVVTPTVFGDDAFGAAQEAAGITFTPYKQKHGVGGNSLGFRFNNFAYSTDVSGLDDAALKTLEGIDTWIVDCAQFGTDFTLVHANFEMVEGWNKRVGARRVILTHLTPRLDFDAVQAQLPTGYEVGYDGLTLEF